MKSVKSAEGTEQVTLGIWRGGDVGKNSASGCVVGFLHVRCKWWNCPYWWPVIKTSQCCKVRRKWKPNARSIFGKRKGSLVAKRYRHGFLICNQSRKDYQPLKVRVIERQFITTKQLTFTKPLLSA